MFRCRRAESKDVDALLDVMQDTKYVHYIYPGKSLEESRRLLLESLASRTYLVCVETQSRKVAGYFIIDVLQGHLQDLPPAVILRKDYAYHAGVGVHTDFRNKGLATRLTRYAFTTARRQGYRGMYADVGSDNEASLRLQEKCGFGELCRYDSTARPKGVQNIVLEKAFS